MQAALGTAAPAATARPACPSPTSLVLRANQLPLPAEKDAAKIRKLKEKQEKVQMAAFRWVGGVQVGWVWVCVWLLTRRPWLCCCGQRRGWLRANG